MAVCVLHHEFRGTENEEDKERRGVSIFDLEGEKEKSERAWGGCKILCGHFVGDVVGGLGGRKRHNKLEEREVVYG